MYLDPIPTANCFHRKAIAMLRQELKTCQASPSPMMSHMQEILSRDIEALVQLMAIRLHFYTGLYDFRIICQNDPSLLAQDIHAHIGPSTWSQEALFPTIESCVRSLEQAATTGVAFFVRTHISSWGFEVVLSKFESAILLAKWIYRFQEVRTPTQGGYWL